MWYMHAPSNASLDSWKLSLLTSISVALTIATSYVLLQTMQVASYRAIQTFTCIHMEIFQYTFWQLASCSSQGCIPFQSKVRSFFGTAIGLWNRGLSFPPSVQASVHGTAPSSTLRSIFIAPIYIVAVLSDSLTSSQDAVTLFTPVASVQKLC